MTKSKLLHQPGRLLMLILCISFIAYGVVGLIFPEQLMQIVGTQLTSPSGFSEVRAMYGGLCIGLGVAFFMGLRRTEWYNATLFLVLTTCAGLAGGRIVSILITGIPNAFELYAGLLLEVISVIIAVRAYQKIST